MKYSFKKVLVLKPQVKLLVFISSQLPDLNWQAVANLQTELTAYHIGDVQDDDGLWDALSINYQQIFQQELVKLIGLQSARQLKLSLLDFLSCFKFEWHDDVQIISTGFLKTVKKVIIKRDNVDVRIPAKQTVCLADICRVLAKSDLQREQVLPLIDMVKLSIVQRILSRYQEFIKSISCGVVSAYTKNAAAMS